MTQSIHRKLCCGKTSAPAAPTITGIHPGDREAYEAFQAAKGSERTRLFRANGPAIFRWQKALESGIQGEASKAAIRPEARGGRNVAPSPAASPKPAARAQALPADPLAPLRAEFRSRFPSSGQDRVAQLRFAVSHCAEVMAAAPGRFEKGSKPNHLRTAAVALRVLREPR
ncbi:MAG: hypothetical protein IAE97_05495 [Chthoniobacterales bacterium]|nr:hypothetical protein [Chthoniobacterales bacterium]